MSHTGYGDKSYWDDRYGVGSDTYEWYMPWATLKADILPHVHATHTPAASHTHAPLRKAVPPKPIDAAAVAASSAHAAPAVAGAATTDAPSSSSSSVDASADAVAPAAPSCVACLGSRVLVVGCGNSELSAHMFADGFTKTLSVDYSQVVIEKMRSLYEQSPALAETFVVGDCRDLRKQCREGEFDVILDKGTLDAILCGTDSNKHSAAMLAEMHRLLRPGGVMLVITYGQPTSRLPILERKQYSWSVTNVALGPTRFMYACKKKEQKK